MADQKINALPVKTAPTTGDKMLMIGAAEEYQIDYDQLATAILNKLTSKTYALDQGTKTLIAALNELNSNSRKIKFFNYDQGGVDVDEKMGDLGTDCAAFLYFGGNLINPPINPDAWTYFSVIIIGTRAFAFSPSNHTNAFAFRQSVNGSWKEWIFV